MIEAELDLGLNIESAWHDRSRTLVANTDRDRLARVLRLLPTALRETSPQKVAEVIAEGACLLTAARVSWVVLPETVPLAVSAGPDAGSVQLDVDPGRWPVVATALAGVHVHVPDLLVAGATAAYAPGGDLGIPVVTDDGRALRSLSAVPITAAGTTLGVLLVAHHRAHAFSERQMALVGSLVEHLGQVFEMCEAVTEQTRVATALQETLLPPVLPEIEGVEVAARYRPSGSGNLVGGDFYDVFSDGEGGWYMLLGDASGIGPESAGLAGVARYTARALAETAAGPAEMLAHINRALLRAAPEDRFCSAVLARVRPLADRTLSVSLGSAGHPPPFVQRASGEVVAATGSTGMILGILPDAAIGEATFTLGPGDAVAFYTDGVLEAQSEDGEQFGEDRLVAVLGDARSRSAAGTARRIERAVVDYRSPDDRDDVAIVVVRCRPTC